MIGGSILRLPWPKVLFGITDHYNHTDHCMQGKENVVASALSRLMRITWLLCCHMLESRWRRNYQGMCGAMMANFVVTCWRAHCSLHLQSGWRQNYQGMCGAQWWPTSFLWWPLLTPMMANLMTCMCGAMTWYRATWWYSHTIGVSPLFSSTGPLSAHLKIIQSFFW